MSLIHRVGWVWVWTLEENVTNFYVTSQTDYLSRIKQRFENIYSIKHFKTMSMTIVYCLLYVIACTSTKLYKCTNVHNYYQETAE